MKNKIIILIFSLILMILILNISISNAIGTISLSSNYDKVLKNENFKININIEDTSIAAMTLYIYFNTDLLEYVSGPDNSNYSNSRIIYTWFSDKGIEEKAENFKDIQFEFKAKENGIASFAVFGDIYDESGNKVNVNFDGTQIEVYEKQAINEGNTVSDSSAYLSQMRLNKEGIMPEFDKNITQYYFLTQDKINNLEVTAIPENPEAKVNIKGNTGLKKGLNKIEIEVTSKDKKNTMKYIINATISDNLENDNTNLENLAIENYYLTPAFDENVTNYTVSVDSKTNNLNILAVPENTGAKIDIKGNDNFKTGNNTVEIEVTSKNRKTTKTYKIIVYKRNEGEDIEVEQEEKDQAEKLSVILEKEENSENNTNRNNDVEKDYNNKEKNNINPIAIICIGAIAIVVIVFGVKMYGKYEHKNV